VIAGRGIFWWALVAAAVGCTTGTSGTASGTDDTLGASGGGGVNDAAVIVPPRPTAAPEPSVIGVGRGPCDVLTDRLRAFGDLLVDENLDRARTAMERVAQYAAEFERLAPQELTGSAGLVAGYYASLRDNTQGATYKEYLAGFSEGYTDEVARASEQIEDWSRSCSLDVYRLSPRAEEIAVCLAAGSSNDDVQRVAARVNVPTGDGAQTDLIDGVALFGDDRSGFKIKLSLAITPERRSEIINLLSAAPVERVLLGVDPQDASHCD
jgi:hypothetical protein